MNLNVSDLVFDATDWTPNKWGGWDYQTTNPNLHARALRIAREDGVWQLHEFTNWNARVLKWTVTFDAATPPPVFAAAIRAALAA